MVMTANAFGVAVPTVTKIVREVCMAIREHLCKEYIKMPKDIDSMKRLVAGWEQTTGFPMVVGAVDGTHIPILQPYINSQDYYSYKMKYTIHVQGVCDYRGQFIDVDIRWPGATHDAKVFAYSSINQRIKDQTHPYLCRTLLPGRDKVGLLLLADPAYPLLPHVMKEYAHCTDDAQVVFNQMLRDARNPIECAYGRLKARWQILTVPLPLKVQDITLIILACFVLHNWCERHNVGIDEVAVQHHINKNIAMNQGEKVDKRYTYTSAGGRAIRDIIKDYFQEHSSNDT